jgi:hypothetical protein
MSVMTNKYKVRDRSALAGVLACVSSDFRQLNKVIEEKHRNKLFRYNLSAPKINLRKGEKKLDEKRGLLPFLNIFEMKSYVACHLSDSHLSISHLADNYLLKESSSLYASQLFNKH